MKKPVTMSATEIEYLKRERRILCATLESATSGHPQPERAAAATARLADFDRKHPTIRNA